MKKIAQSVMALSLVIPSAALIHTSEPVVALTQKEVTSYSLNVRTGPGSNYKVVDWLQKGQVVNVLKDGKGWDYIQTSNGKSGYAYDEYLKNHSNANQKSASKASVSGQTRTVTSYSLTLRNGPSADNKAIGWLGKGTKVNVISTSGNWSKVSVNGNVGYVNNAYLSKTPSSSKTVSSSQVKTTEVRKVIAHTLTLRTGPSTEYRALSYLPQGTNVTVHTYQGGWAYITAKGKTGYVNSKYLSKGATSTSTTTPSPAKPSTQTSSETKYIKATDGLNLRSGRGTQYSVIVNMPYSAKVTVSGISNGWGKVTYGKYTGYANVGYLTSSKPVASSSAKSSRELKGKLIVLDPGHGGPYAGARKYVKEEMVNLQIALKTKAKLEQMGARVIMTRNGNNACDYSSYRNDLNCRPAIATKNHASAFVSIHANSGSASASGTETYYYNIGRGDQRLAKEIINEINEEVGMKKRRVDFGDFAVIRNSTVPSTLIETGFVTNKADAAKLASSSYQDKYAKAIAEGIRDFF